MGKPRKTKNFNMNKCEMCLELKLPETQNRKPT